MITVQDIIDKQLKIVKERDEIINSDEFSLICEADSVRPPGEKWYSKHRSLVSPGAKVGASAISLLTVGLYGWYRKATDKCSQRCKGLTGNRISKCNAICNMNASKHVIDKIKSNKGKLASIKDPEKKAKATQMLNKEYEKWQDRYEKYKDRAQASSLTTAQLKFKD